MTLLLCETAAEWYRCYDETAASVNDSAADDKVLLGETTAERINIVYDRIIME